MMVQADGHCLYRAVSNQLQSNGAGSADDHQAVRAKAAAYMRAHPDQFLPFMPEACTPAGLLYVAEWLALARIPLQAVALMWLSEAPIGAHSQMLFQHLDIVCLLCTLSVVADNRSE